MSGIGNVMILASAGSGKTYALTNRFVRLLALGAQPERIVALTFTRKAAGEFFDEILKKLAHAAEDSAYAMRLADQIEVPNFGSRQFLSLLRKMVGAMHRLQLGTLDGFFARIARNFPLELGLAGEFEILQEHALRIERARVLRKMFERSGQLDDSQREFIEAFKRATFGADEKRLGAQLDAFLDEHQEIFLGAPLSGYWGNPERIWPAGLIWSKPEGRASDSLAALDAWVSGAALADKQRGRWIEFLAAWSEWSPGVVPSRPLAYVLEKVLSKWADIEAGRAVLEFDRKKQELSAAACAALADLTRRIVSAEISRRIETTRGIHAVLDSYERIYDNAVRRSGKLTFGDVQRLLMPGGKRMPVLSGESRVEGRLFIDYRLDAEIDHWLLDEFQDTSFGQWSILRNLIDEAVQDPTGSRTLFYVGDMKQSIFAWRDGDPKLFREIFDYYNSKQAGTIVEQRLVKSWRSGPAIIAAVNRVFGDAAVLGDLFPGNASESWNREWRAHESADLGIQGQVGLLHGDDEESRFATALAVLQEVNPLERGHTCALLVQSNATATRLAEYLRREGGLPAIAESDLHVCVDNPVGSALLALMKVAAHPGDSFAVEHLRMTPLGGLLAQHGFDVPERRTAAILRQVHRDGFERTMAYWIRELRRECDGWDAFNEARAAQFTAAAALFDATGSRDVGEFIQYMERYTLREVEGAAALRVMTIHKSKGLGFDVVILPDLEGVRLDCRREGLAVQKSADREVEWVLDLPGKLFHSQDAVLSAHVHAAESDACYESLSLLYVAMTRAKRAMYLITKLAANSTSRNYPKLLAETLGNDCTDTRIGLKDFPGSFSTGDPNWFLSATLAPPKAPAPRISTLSQEPTPRASAVPPQKPSHASHGEVLGESLFSRGKSRGSDFGTLVHRLFAEIEWLSEQIVSDKVKTWEEQGIAAEVIDYVAACISSPALADVWRPRRPCEVWRERAFEVILDGHWYTGIFDRVIVETDGHGRATRVSIYDFKTDAAKTESELEKALSKYSAQLRLYRRAAGLLVKVAPENVRSAVVSTARHTVVRV